MSTSTHKAKATVWGKGKAIRTDRETGKPFTTDAYLSGNLALFALRDDSGKPYDWRVIHQPSNLQLFRADTRRGAISLASDILEAFGPEFLDRMANNTGTKQDEANALRIRAMILERPRISR